MTDRARRFLDQVLDALGGPGAAPPVDLPPGGSLPSVFVVSDLAQASVGAAAASLARLVALDGGAKPTSTVDRDLALAWFGYSIRPMVGTPVGVGLGGRRLSHVGQGRHGWEPTG